MGTENKRKYYILAFLLGCIPFLVSAVSFIAQNGWIFYLYGDFNTQQIPFTLYTSRNISNFHMPQFDFNAGAGLDYLNAYSFYNLFSPFTFIYALIPDNAAAYALPFVMALKMGICSLSAYIYISRFCKTRKSALIGAVLYTYSGFQMVNIIFHYMDAMAFFPLLLASLEAAVIEKRRVIFAVTVALCAFTNYYIFGMEVIFLILYFLIRLTDKSFRISIKDFLCLGLESILGVMAAGIVMIPAVVCIINNPRLGEPFQNIRDMLLYERIWRYPRILQSIFMLPDLQGNTNFFPDSSGVYPYGSRWSSQAMYIPMFGISGFIAYMLANRKSWQTKLVSVCLIIAFVPVFNSIFTVGSSLYYARWMFAPTLIMAAMTACAIENEPKYFRTGMIINIGAVLLITVFCIIFPMEKLSVWESVVYNNYQKWIQIIFTLAGIILAFVLLFRLKRDDTYYQKLVLSVAAFAFIASEIMLLFAMGGTEYYPELISDTYINQDMYPEIEQTDQEYRIDTDYALENKMLLWGIGSSYCFNSIVNPYMAQYCDALGILNESIPYDYTAQCLMSVKNYLAYAVSGWDASEPLPIMFSADKFSFTGQKGAYQFFENTNYIPMGFCYEYCISEDELLTLDIEIRKRLMLKAMAVDDVSAVSEYLTPIPADEIYLLDDEEFSAECAKRAEKTAFRYTTDDDSYTASITLEEPELVFFSVAYDEGFTAYVDGEKTNIINANFGFQAIPVPAGTHTVQVKYHSVWRDIGIAASVAGLSGLAVYTVIYCILNRKRKN